MGDDMRFGPQTAHIEALLRRARALSADEGAAWRAARLAAWDAALDAARLAALEAALDAARDAALALVVRDLIGQHGFTQGHYDTLTARWAQVIGKVHPDDKEALRG